MCILVLVLTVIGMQEAHKWIDKPSEERNLTNRSRGVGKYSMHPLKSTGRKVWPKELCSREGNTSLCWVCRYCGGEAR